MKPETMKARLLLVEDHAATAATLLAMLNGLGISRVTHVSSTAEAIELLQRGGFDLILCDYQLGPVNGLVLVRMIRRPEGIANPNIPLVMITAHAEPERVSEALSAGVDDLLVKPVQPETLARCVAQALERPRSFVKTKDYAGPDRRRRQMAGHPGRRLDDRQGRPIPQNKWIVPPRT